MQESGPRRGLEGAGVWAQEGGLKGRKVQESEVLTSYDNHSHHEGP